MFDDREAWKALVKKYANGRPICNCGEAYYTACGVGIDAQGYHRTDMLCCKHGCSSNLITTKYEIAQKVLQDIENK